MDYQITQVKRSFSEQTNNTRLSEDNLFLTG
jgi:hypothetical protein